VRVKLDENLPATLRDRLRKIGFDVDTAVEEGLRAQPDAKVWESAQRAGRFFVTQDLDFSDARRFVPGAHYGLLLVRLPDSEQWRVGDFVVAWMSMPSAKTWEKCFVVASPGKVRVLRPR
jgi:predicted nuclease of predicted toxin-antitoxin system